MTPEELRPKPTDSEQLEADLMHVLLGGGTPTGNMRLAAPSLEIKGKVEIIKQLIQERDQQWLSAWMKERATYRRTWMPKADVLSAVLEAVDDELIPFSHYTECLRLLHEDDATIPDDCSCGAELRMKQALTAALGPDNSKIEEQTT
jgi:hypothetical protein